MAKGMYIGVDGVARKVKNQYIGVDNVARKVTKGYIGVDNVARQCFAAGPSVGELEVGSIVWLKVSDGSRRKFRVVHQGLPDQTIYDRSCYGTWLLMETLYDNVRWDDELNSYEISNINTYLNDTFFDKFDSDIQTIIKQVKIPYIKTDEKNNHTDMSGESGLLTKIFLLSEAEVKPDSTSKDGSCLDYFSDGESYKRKGYNVLDESSMWWLRTPRSSAGRVTYVDIDGTLSNVPMSAAIYARPALILPSGTLIDENFIVLC